MAELAVENVNQLAQKIVVLVAQTDALHHADPTALGTQNKIYNKGEIYLWQIQK